MFVLPHRYKMCNSENCPPGSVDFRNLQCSEYDHTPHEGHLYSWEPVDLGDLEPCALTCKPKNHSGPIVTLNPRVLDGTRCHKHSVDMCINGRCQVSLILY